MSDVKLSPEQYWRWRTTIAEMDHGNANYESGQLRYGHMLKDLEISRLSAVIYKQGQLQTLEEKRNLLKKEYENEKKKIEDELGVSLNNCVIDDIDFSVKSLDEQKT